MQRAKKSIISKVALKEILLRELPELLKEDPLLKDYIASLFKEHFADKRTTEEEIKALLEEIKNLRIESEKKWEEHSKRLEEAFSSKQDPYGRDSCLKKKTGYADWGPRGKMGY